MTAPRYSSRRRRHLRPWALYTSCTVVGFAIGLGGSIARPGPWWGADDAFERVQRVEPGHLLVQVPAECYPAGGALSIGGEASSWRETGVDASSLIGRALCSTHPLRTATPPRSEA